MSLMPIWGKKGPAPEEYDVLMQENASLRSALTEKDAYIENLEFENKHLNAKVAALDTQSRNEQGGAVTDEQGNLYSNPAIIEAANNAKLVEIEEETPLFNTMVTEAALAIEDKSNELTKEPQDLER